MASPSVVIVGGGFGGLACARKLDGRPVDVVLVDGRNYHLFTPLLYQVATALLNAPDIAYPFRTTFRRSRNVRFRQGHVTGVDFGRRSVRLSSGDELPYDYLVLATGSTNNYYGNQALAESALGMKTLAEAQTLRNHVLSCLELASQEEDAEERRRYLTFVVVGGGPTGVEYAGALVELLHLVLGRDYPDLRREEARIVLAEGRDRLLGAFPETLGSYARRVLERRGVEVHTGSLVESASGGHVTLSTGGDIATRTIVWSAGVRPDDPAGAAAARTRSRRLVVDERLRVPGAAGVYAIGDVSAATEGGAELPMLSPPAMQEGRYVARAILAEAGGASRPPEPFRYRDKGTMAVIGRNAGVASFHGIRLKGLLGWLAWLVVHLYYIVGFRNRIAVFTLWGWNYVRKDRPIRLITRIEPDPVTSLLLDVRSAEAPR